MTRRQMFECIRLAEVPDDEFERIMALPWKEKISAIRHIKSGQWRRGVVDADAHIRLPRELFDMLSKHAKHQGKSVSALVIELMGIAPTAGGTMTEPAPLPRDNLAVVEGIAPVCKLGSTSTNVTSKGRR